MFTKNFLISVPRRNYGTGGFFDWPGAGFPPGGGGGNPRLDCPEIFYAVGFRCRFYKDGRNIEIIPEYLFDKGKVKEHQKAMKARVAKLIRPAQAMQKRQASDLSLAGRLFEP